MEAISSTATWPVLHGALGSCLSVESSLCPLDPSSAVSAPLVLQRPPSDVPNSAPCDITIVFPKKHEIQQIYVRSTARIYEIYYAPNSTSGNEYLCTVRCSPVENDSEAVKETESQTSSRSSNTSTSEDGWVDITKSLDSNASKINASAQRTKEDLYEATAEISDAEPCISLTLRLLSIQSTGYVFVDEIYVYGNQVDDDNEEQKNPVGSAAGSSLMALLAPTLLQLQLSKSGIGSTNNSCNSKQPQDPRSNDNGSQGADLITATHENLSELRPSASSQQVITYHMGHTAANAAEPNHSHVPLRVPDEVVNHNITTDYPSHIEKALNELISRVIKIEDTCARFEENMRKPMCSIEDRLSRVEEQLSVLAKSSQNSKFASGTRFSAPDWSCIESASNSSDIDESNLICGTAYTLDIPSVSLPAQPPGNGSSISVETIEVPPSHSPTALYYATHDAEDTDPSIPIHDTSSEQPKKTVSIDDALASALAAFMSSGHTQTLNKGFSIKAPEYSTSEESDNNNVHLSVTVSQCAETSSSVRHEDETDVTHCKEILSFFSNNVAHDVQDLLENDPSSDQIEQSSCRKLEDISQFVNGEGSQVNEDNESSSGKFERGVQCASDEEAHHGHQIVSNRSNDEANTEHTSGEDTHSDDSVYQMEHEVGDHQQRARNDKEATNQEALLEITELACMPLPVNFDTSILDVMFVSGEISSASPSLEALLTDTMAGYQVEAPCDAEVSCSGDATTDHDFISVENETSILETTDSTEKMHHYDLETTSLVIENKLTESETVKDLHSNLSHEVFPASLI